MSGLFATSTWSDEIVQLLDEHHLVVLADTAVVRDQFADGLSQRLAAMADTQVIDLHGRGIRDVPAFCSDLERQLTNERADGGKAGPPKAWWRDIMSVIAALRTPTGARRRYIIWRDADAMLESDVKLFGQLVNALLSVAAEHEHVSLELLVLQRAVFIGGPKLGAYAEDSTGQFCRWLDDAPDSPFWEVVSVIDRPPVLTYRIEG